MDGSIRPPGWGDVVAERPPLAYPAALRALAGCFAEVMRLLVTSAGRSIRLHDLLARPGVHILLDRDAGQPGPLPPGRPVHVHRLASVPGRGLIAVRPDGYVGFRCQATEVRQLAAWLDRLRAWQPDAKDTI